MIKLFFAGDFAPCRLYGPLLEKKGADVFGELKNDIADSDFAFLNLETPLCRTEHKIEKSGPSLQAAPSCTRAIADAGFNVIGLANNHIMDCGADGLLETFDALKEAKLFACGAGHDIREASQPLIVEKHGFKIAYIAVTEEEFSIAGTDKCGAAPLDIIDNILQVQNARSKADLVFVTIHGGNEYYPLPRPKLRKLCRFLIECGADGIICHHPHVAGAYEFYDGKPIVYSLGNLIFDHSNPPDGWNEGYALTLKYRTGESVPAEYEIIPYSQSVGQGGICKYSQSEKVAFMKRMNKYSEILKDEAEYLKAWDAFCKKTESNVILRMFFPYSFRGLGKLNKLFKLHNRLLPEKTLLSKLNTVRCESHRELLQSILEKRC